MSEIKISVKLSWILFHNLQKTNRATLSAFEPSFHFAPIKMSFYTKKKDVSAKQYEEGAPDQATRAKHYFPVSTLSLYSL